MSNNNQLSPYKSGAVALRSAAYRSSTAAPNASSHRALVSTPQRTSRASSSSQSQASRVQLTPTTVAREKVASVHLDQSLIFGSPRKSTKASASTEKPKRLSPEKSDDQLGYLQKGRLEIFQRVKVNTRAELAAEGAKRQAARATAPEKRMNPSTSPISTTAPATNGNGPGPAAYFPCKPAATKEERRHLDMLDKIMAELVKEKEIEVVQKITEGLRMEVRDIVKETIPKSMDTHNYCIDTIIRFYEPTIPEKVEKFKDSAPKGESLVDYMDSQTNQWIKNFSKEVRYNIDHRHWTLETATVPKEMSTPNESKDTESTSNTVVQRVHEASPLETTGGEAGLSNKDVGDNAVAVGLVQNVVPPKTQSRKDNEPRILTPAQKKTKTTPNSDVPRKVAPATSHPNFTAERALTPTNPTDNGILLKNKRTVDCAVISLMQHLSQMPSVRRECRRIAGNPRDFCGEIATFFRHLDCVLSRKIAHVRDLRESLRERGQWVDPNEVFSDLITILTDASTEIKNQVAVSSQFVSECGQPFQEEERLKLLIHGEGEKTSLTETIEQPSKEQCENCGYQASYHEKWERSKPKGNFLVIEKSPDLLFKEFDPDNIVIYGEIWELMSATLLAGEEHYKTYVIDGRRWNIIDDNKREVNIALPETTKNINLMLLRRTTTLIDD